MTDLRLLLDARLRTLRILWSSFLTSVAVHGLVLAQAMPAEVQPDSPFPGVALVLIPALVVVLGVARRQLLGPRLGLLAPDLLRAQPAPVDAELVGHLRAALGRYLTGTVVGLAIAEVTALLGLVSSFLTGDPTWYLLHAAAAGALFLIQVPRLDGVLALLTPDQARAVVEAVSR